MCYRWKRTICADNIITSPVTWQGALLKALYLLKYTSLYVSSKGSIICKDRYETAMKLSRDINGAFFQPLYLLNDMSDRVETLHTSGKRSVIDENWHDGLMTSSCDSSRDIKGAYFKTLYMHISPKLHVRSGSCVFKEKCYRWKITWNAVDIITWPFTY
jgi:hypothetical protein